MIETVLAKFAPIVAAVLLLVATSVPAAAQFEQLEAQECLTNRALQSAIASGNVPPVSDVLTVGPGDELLSVELCQGGNRALAYRVRVLDRNGDASTLVLPVEGDRQ
jgi:hypothetical protein